MSLLNNSGVSEQDIFTITQLLGRHARGLRAIPVRNPSGQPVVLQVASLVDNKPFPTLFWLVDPEINYAIDRLEASGQIAEWQYQLDQSPEDQQNLIQNHADYIQLRQELMTEDDIREIETLGFSQTLTNRGIGGIENFTRIRCLHTYYAAHLVTPNLIGKWLDELWLSQGQKFQNMKHL